MKTCWLFFGLLLSVSVQAQFAPQAGMPGSSAVHKDDAAILAWGDSVRIQRGWINVADTLLGRTTFGDSSMAKGKADGMVVSLGDGGEALYYFRHPVMNGVGPDFAVYENGFLHPENGHLAYLEFATVEVSSDGIFFVPFPVLSEWDTLTQIAGTGEYLDCRKVDGLAGKYIAYYGTPFDLDLLAGTAGLDVQAIHYIRVRDVVGNLQNAYCQRDAQNRKINDPYPTDFPTGGFDLDGLAVLHTQFPTQVETPQTAQRHVYPNPATNRLWISDATLEVTHFRISTLNGELLSEGIPGNEGIAVEHLARGTYVLRLQQRDGTMHSSLFSKW